MRFYKFPIKFDTVYEDDVTTIPKCNEKESIDQSLDLILTTCPGEHKFNKNFGCRIWDMDFERVVSRSKWEEKFTSHIINAINDFEPRLKNVEVSLKVNDVMREDVVLKTTAIKKQVTVFVNGKLVSTDENCGFYYTLYLGPLSTG